MSFDSPTHHPYFARGADAADVERSVDAKMKAASAFSSASPPTRSPTTVFAIDEVSSVFRVPDDAVERRGPPVPGAARLNADRQAPSAGASVGLIRRARCLTPSFGTDGELSTFSEESDETSSNGSDSDEEHFRFPARRSGNSSSLRSIFRPVSGIKRRSCEYDEDNDDEFADCTPAKRSCSAPTLRHANPIGSSDDDGCENDEQPLLLSPARSFASPFKRVCRNDSGFATASVAISSPYSSLFAETGAYPTTISPNGQDVGADEGAAATLSIAPCGHLHLDLEHPLSFSGTMPLLKRASSLVSGSVKNG